MLRFTNVVLFLVSLAVAAGNVYAEEAETLTLKEIAEKEKETAEVLKELSDEPLAGPADEFNRSTPRSSLLALAKALQAHDYEKAVNYIDLRNLPFSTEEINGEEIVRKLHIIGKRAMDIDVTDLSNDPNGHKDDGLPSYRDRITTVKTKNGPVDILMQRVPRGDGVFIWKVSNATVAMVPELDEEFGYGIIGDKLSTLFPSKLFMGFEVWQLIMLVGLLISAFLIAYVITVLLNKVLRRSERFNRPRLHHFVAGPLRLLIMILIFRSTFHMIAPTLVARAMFEAKTVLILAMLWVFLGVVDLLKYRIAERMERNGQADAVVLLRPIATAVKLTIVLLAIITWLNNLGYEVTAVLAGLGVGGIAVALAAQKSLENLIGSITIYASQPVRVGDFCKFQDTVGTVEEIGLRSTQLRTLARTVVHIPNALFSSAEIENLTQRDKILYRTRLRLSYDVSPEKIRAVLEKIRELIKSHELIDTKSSRVRFFEFGEYAQELDLFVYIKTSDFAEYLELREDINLQLVDILEQENVKLTVPVQKTFLSGEAELQAD